MKNPKFKELYGYLAGEEVKHPGYLEEYRGKKELSAVSTESPGGQSFSPEFDPARTKLEEITLGGPGILLAAMRHKRNSENFFQSLKNEPKTKVREISSRCCQCMKVAITSLLTASLKTSTGSACRPEKCSVL